MLRAYLSKKLTRPLPMDTGHLRALSTVTSLYDFTANGGAKNIGAWIDAAAVKVGR
jgi:hypothetical protein